MPNLPPRLRRRCEETVWSSVEPLHGAGPGSGYNLNMDIVVVLQVEFLGQLHELLIRSEPAHLDTVLPDVVEFQVGCQMQNVCIDHQVIRRVMQSYPAAR